MFSGIHFKFNNQLNDLIHNLKHKFGSLVYTSMSDAVHNTDFKKSISIQISALIIFLSVFFLSLGLVVLWVMLLMI